MSDQSVHKRPLEPGEAGERFVRYYRRLSDLGLAPRIIRVTSAELVTELCMPLDEWLRDGQSESDRLAVGRRLYGHLERLHTNGICHRDVHAASVVLRGGEPLLIDPMFATESDPSRPCYDLYGPQASGVSVPLPHQGCAPNRGGVWWDCTAEVPTLGEYVAPLSAALASITDR